MKKEEIKKDYVKQFIFTLDTSIKGVSLTFLDAEEKGARKLLWQRIVCQEYASSSLIQNLWQEGLGSIKASSEQILACIISTGPGSFTGIKIGLAWVYGLQASLRKKILFLETSALSAAVKELSAQLSHKKNSFNKNIILCLANTPSYGYGVIYGRAESSPFSYQFKDKHLQGEGFSELLQESALDKHIVYMVGASPQLISCFQERGAQVELLAHDELLSLSCHGMIHLAQKASFESFRMVLPSPNYLRKSAAEENRRQ